MSGFTFNQVVDILRNAVGVREDARSTLVARIQQLQKIGLPQRANVGRGGKVRYSNWQVADLAFFLALQDRGVAPALIADTFGQTPVFEEHGYALEQNLLENSNCYGVFMPEGLAKLKQANTRSSREATRTAWQVYEEADLVHALRRRTSIVVPLTALYLDILSAAQAVEPPLAHEMSFERSLAKSDR